ncbi:MAG: zf-TFIIB domain-containing protein [Plectolyngbya sp. WJT66-NPBG17]|jgi:Zn-finger nucleic acid-binding protein|nr:zf-TFIIB domain-containing protein [Plectolyngbya sp. WJT66-NPBG17]MBW4524569.1 zf-TFIIB domain-containing protein [Phormidium tanganyikae FI6-MK23]
MQCPKERKITLTDGTLTEALAVKQCPDCKGTWIPSENYKLWQAERTQSAAEPPRPKTVADLIPKTLDVEFVQSPLDAKAALCPDCGSYLARAKVGMKAPFYVERCLICGGIWCDRGEWDALEAMGLHIAIEQLFSSEWQILSREREHLAMEKQATIDRLGVELANRVFELAEVLEKHPSGDFGVAYLMRRFENFTQELKPKNKD